MLCCRAMALFAVDAVDDLVLIEAVVSVGKILAGAVIIGCGIWGGAVAGVSIREGAASRDTVAGSSVWGDAAAGIAVIRVTRPGVTVEGVVVPGIVLPGRTASESVVSGCTGFPYRGIGTMAFHAECENLSVKNRRISRITGADTPVVQGRIIRYGELE